MWKQAQLEESGSEMWGSVLHRQCPCLAWITARVCNHSQIFPYPMIQNNWTLLFQLMRKYREHLQRLLRLYTIRNASLSAFQMQNDFMREFLHVRDAILARMMDSEAHSANALCSLCPELGIWRCVDCLGRPLHCRQHCWESHTKNICHRIQKWTGQYFLDCQMWEVGVKLYLGHRGDPCPHFEDTNLVMEANLDRMPDVAPHSLY